MQSKSQSHNHLPCTCHRACRIGSKCPQCHEEEEQQSPWLHLCRFSCFPVMRNIRIPKLRNERSRLTVIFRRKSVSQSHDFVQHAGPFVFADDGVAICGGVPLCTGRDATRARVGDDYDERDGCHGDGCRHSWEQGEIGKSHGLAGMPKRCATRAGQRRNTAGGTVQFC